MKRILIDPHAKSVRDIDIPTGSSALEDVIGDCPERAVVFPNGDELYVDANGFLKKEQAYFDIGARQIYPGLGVITGAKNGAVATSIDDIRALAKFVGYRPPPSPRAVQFETMGDAMLHLFGRREAELKTGQDQVTDGIVLHYSILDMSDQDLGPLGTVGDDDDEWVEGEELYPHIQMFPETGNTELIWARDEDVFSVNAMPSVRWMVPFGVPADVLKAALQPGKSLRTSLAQARSALRADLEIIKACNAVALELAQLHGV